MHIIESCGCGTSSKMPQTRRWLPFKIGRSGFLLAPNLDRADRNIRFGLYMHQKGVPPKQAFQALVGQKTEIEAALGSALD